MSFVPTNRIQQTLPKPQQLHAFTAVGIFAVCCSYSLLVRCDNLLRCLTHHRTNVGSNPCMSRRLTQKSVVGIEEECQQHCVIHIECLCGQRSGVSLPGLL